MNRSSTLVDNLRSHRQRDVRPREFRLLLVLEKTALLLLATPHILDLARARPFSLVAFPRPDLGPTPFLLLSSDRNEVPDFLPMNLNSHLARRGKRGIEVGGVGKSREGGVAGEEERANGESDVEIGLVD
jgi:hypothetical protein